MKTLMWSRWGFILVAILAARNPEVNGWWIVAPLAIAFGIDQALIWWSNVTSPKITIN